MSNGSIYVDSITRVEGHGSIEIDLKNKNVKLEITEGARFFEGILKGRKYDEVQSIVTRICAICSSSHALTSVKTLENALDVEITEQTDLLRKLLLYGEIIQSHALHLYFLSLPDFLGYEHAIAMAKDHLREVKEALRIKRLGNMIREIVGGRTVHQITTVVGGFTKIPSEREQEKILKELRENVKIAENTVEIFENVDYPDLEEKTEYISLKSEEYPLYYSEKIHSSQGWEIDLSKYKDYILEELRPYSNAKFGVRDGRGYMVGALARLNLNRQQLNEKAKETLENSRINFPNHNPYVNNYAQAIEILHLMEECINILENNKFKPEKPVEIRPKAGEGIAAHEVPRGTLYHHYRLNRKGIIEYANVITPTAQNLFNMENNLRKIAHKYLDKGCSKETRNKMVFDMEKCIRAYDPCISCSAHFLKVKYI
ncbi:MAG TPA: Ni/Fe hydrogenase subunit alpha [Thermoplasmatales archaeon]|nr:Ni/Fe hydrogenase subunit alpha [Thermoplasmatales archaeon]